MIKYTEWTSTKKLFVKTLKFTKPYDIHNVIDNTVQVFFNWREKDKDCTLTDIKDLLSLYKYISKKMGVKK
jgi:hypothetical protein